MRRSGLALRIFAVNALAMWTVPGLPAYGAENYRWQYGASISYSTGDYGGEGDTKFLYVPVTVKRYWDKADLTLTVPYVSLSSESSATIIDGTLVGGSGSDATDGTGLGDLILKGRYYAVEQDGVLPFIDLVGKVKVPTADEDKGLGTGQLDVSAIVELCLSTRNRYFWLAELGYTLIGDPPDIDYRNRLSYSLGFGAKVNPALRLYGYLDGRTALLDGNDNPLSLLLYGEYRLRDNLRLDGDLELGLNDGAPDLGVTLGVRWKCW